MKKKINKSNPRFGSKLGQVIDGWKCTARYFLNGSITTWRKTNQKNTIFLKFRYDDSRWGVGLIEVCNNDDSNFIFLSYFDDFPHYTMYQNSLEKYHISFPEHIKTSRQKKKFVIDLAKLYGYGFK